MLHITVKENYYLFRNKALQEKNKCHRITFVEEPRNSYAFPLKHHGFSGAGLG